MSSPAGDLKVAMKPRHLVMMSLGSAAPVLPPALGRPPPRLDCPNVTWTFMTM